MAFRKLDGKVIRPGLMNVAGVLLLAIYSSSYSNYNNTDAWNKVKEVADFIAYILTNPYVGFLFSGLLIFLGTIPPLLKLAKLESEQPNVNGLKDKVNDSEEQMQQLRSELLGIHQNHVKTWLKAFFRFAGFDTNARVSIYYEDSGRFYLLSRYSSNPDLGEHRRQKLYAKQGVIREAWRHGEHHEKECPEYELSANLYLNYMIDKYGFEEEKLESISNKCATFFGLSITQADENIGVILIESVKSDAFDATCISSIKDYCREFESHLCGFVRDSIRFDKTIDTGRKHQRDVDNEVLGELRR